MMMIMPGFHYSVAVAVSPFPLRKFRKNYVSAVRITLPTRKIPLCRCCCHLAPLRRNCRSVGNRIEIESYFCRSAVYGQPISVLVSGHFIPMRIRKDVSSNFVLARNGSYATEERQRNGGNQA